MYMYLIIFNNSDIKPKIVDPWSTSFEMTVFDCKINWFQDESPDKDIGIKACTRQIIFLLTTTTIFTFLFIVVFRVFFVIKL